MTDYNPISSLQKQIDLLRMEMEYERQNHALTLATKHLDNHIQESDCRYPVSIGNSEYNALDQLILTIRYEISEDSVDTDFEPGKPLRLFFLDNDSHIHELPHLCFIEQVGYGLGFTAYTLYLVSFSHGERSTSVFSFCTAFQYLGGVMLPGMVSGWMSDQMGYQQFFIAVMGFCLVTFAVTALVKIPEE